MTEEQKDRALAESLEAYHRTRARGEVVDLEAYRERLGDLYEEFFELVMAETAIDAALDSASEQALPQNWGSYLLLGEIGRGAAGVVYEAMHRDLGRKVALKVLRTGVDTDATARERFRREAQALAQVRHDNIVEIYEYGEMGDRLFYAMSLVQGPSLAALNKANRRPTPADLCRGLAGIADALQALHEAGIVHRDVKPSNIMIGPDGRYLLADFGLARTDLAETMTRTGDALGTPLYMSPEQMLGKRDAVEARTDVYGLGATLYQLLTGAPPFKTDNLHALMRMVLSQRPQNPRAVAPELPPGCSSIAMKCLEKEPGDRYARAADLAQDLRAFADGDRVSGKPLTGPQRGMRLIKRRPLVSALAVAASFLVAVGAWNVMKPADPLPASTLSVRSPRFEASVTVNGETRPAPLVRHLLKPQTENRVVVQPNADGWRPYETTYPGEPGNSDLVIPFFEPANLDDPSVVGASLEALGVQPTKELPGMERHRGSANVDLELRFPRGVVRRVDLVETGLIVFQSALFDPGAQKANLQFLRGEEVLHSEPFPELDPDRVQVLLPFPQAVLDKIRPGDTVEWGYVPVRKSARHRNRSQPFHRSTFTLASEELAARVETQLEQVEAGLGRIHWQSPEARQVIAASARGEILLAAGMAQPALQAVLPLIGTGEGPAFEPASTATQALVELERKILFELYPSKPVRDEAPLYTEVRYHRKKWSDDEWKAFDTRRLGEAPDK